MTSGDRRTGIIAGAGGLPLAVAESLASRGGSVYIAALKGIASDRITRGPWAVNTYAVTRLAALREGLREAGVKDLVLAGKVRHELALGGAFDAELKTLLQGLTDLRGNTILTGLADHLEAAGFQVLSLLDAAPALVAPAGFRAGPGLSKAQKADAAFGWEIARQLASLDVGQAVVVKNLSVVAVEGMEGTSEMILRAGTITGGGNTVVKVASPDHDFRFDVPTVGVDTVEAIVQAGGGALVVEAGACFLLERDEMIQRCRREGISVVAMTDGGAGNT